LHSKAIKPCLPQMIGKLLEALSGMEDPVRPIDVRDVAVKD